MQTAREADIVVLAWLGLFNRRFGHQTQAQSGFVPRSFSATDAGCTSLPASFDNRIEIMTNALRSSSFEIPIRASSCVVLA